MNESKKCPQLSIFEKKLKKVLTSRITFDILVIPHEEKAVEWSLKTEQNVNSKLVRTDFQIKTKTV